MDDLQDLVTPMTWHDWLTLTNIRERSQFLWYFQFTAIFIFNLYMYAAWHPGMACIICDAYFLISSFYLLSLGSIVLLLLLVQILHLLLLHLPLVLHLHLPLVFLHLWKRATCLHCLHIAQSRGCLKIEQGAFNQTKYFGTKGKSTWT